MSDFIRKYTKKLICWTCHHYIKFSRRCVFEKKRPKENNTCDLYVLEGYYGG